MLLIDLIQDFVIELIRTLLVEGLSQRVRKHVEGRSARRKRRRQQAALPAPLAAFGEKNTLADQRAHDARRHARANIIRRVRRHHVANALGVVDQNALDAEGLVAAEGRIEGIIGEYREAVADTAQKEF